MNMSTFSEIASFAVPALTVTLGSAVALLAARIVFRSREYETHIKLPGLFVSLDTKNDPRRKVDLEEERADGESNDSETESKPEGDIAEREELRGEWPPDLRAATFSGAARKGNLPDFHLEKWRVEEERLRATQFEIYEKYHASAIRTSGRYSAAAYVAFVGGLIILLVAAVLVLFNLIAPSIATGTVALLDFASGAFFSRMAKNEQARADEKFAAINREVDRTKSLSESLRIAHYIKDERVRDTVLAQLALGGTSRAISEPNAPREANSDEGLQQEPEW